MDDRLTREIGPQGYDPYQHDAHQVAARAMDVIEWTGPLVHRAGGTETVEILMPEREQP